MCGPLAMSVLVSLALSLLTHFPHSETKNTNILMTLPYSVRVCVAKCISPKNSPTPKQIFKKRGMYIMPSVVILVTYVIIFFISNTNIAGCETVEVMSLMLLDCWNQLVCPLLEL
jgi:Na+/melibiose symporter-like transporter